MNSSKNEEWHIIILMMMIITINTNTDKYFLLAEFSVLTVNYRPSFSIDLWPKREAHGP